MSKRGRPEFVPTDEQRGQVEMLSGLGLPHDQIADALDISDETLRKYFDKELLSGMRKANGKVARFLFQQAQVNLTAAIFWAKTRMRWRETDRLELTGKDGDELIPKLVVNLHTSKKDGK